MKIDPIYVVVAVITVAFPALIYCSIQEEKEWEAFAAEHRCKVVGQIKGDSQTGIGYGVAPSGQFGTITTTTTTPSKTGYLCDDGVTYWR